MRIVWWLSLCLVAGCAHREPASPSPATPSPNSQGAPAASRPAGEAGEGDPHPHEHSRGYAKDFSPVQAYAARFDSPARDAWQKPHEVVRLLSVEPGQTLADVGAGTGYFLGPLSQAVGPRGRVLALDVEPNMIQYMEQRVREQGWSQVELRQVAPHDPGLDAGSVDRILIVNTWHHIADRVQYARKLRAALREGGVVMVVDFTRESDIGPPLEHRLSAEQVAEELSLAGLQPEIVEETLPKQYVVVGRAKTGEH